MCLYKAGVSFASGIGKALATKLAKQGINVVVVALGDNMLESAMADLQATFPSLEFRKVSIRCILLTQIVAACGGWCNETVKPHISSMALMVAFRF